MSCLAGPAGADPTGSKGRTIMANQAGLVGGIDSHRDTIHVAVITKLGVAWRAHGSRVPDHHHRLPRRHRLAGRSRIADRKRRNDDLDNGYRAWLHAA